jgi:hypothetical protein
MEYELCYELKCGIFERMDNMRKNVKLTGVFAVVLAVVLACAPAAWAVVTLTGDLSWDGTYGAYAAPGDGTGSPTLTVPTYTEGNLARGPLATPIASDVLAGYTAHTIEHINDGNYGNNYSWIPGAANPGWAGVNLGETVNVNAIAFSRSNTMVPFVDLRIAGNYAIQYADSNSVDPNWVTIGTVEYDANTYENSLRHVYKFPAVETDRVRIVVSPWAKFLCIDEIELYYVDPIKAINPFPSNGSSVGPSDLLLEWDVEDPGSGPGTLTGYHVYYDPDPGKLNPGMAGDKGIVTDQEYLITAAQLQVNINYSWRIDVIFNDGGLETVVEGDVWNFTPVSHTFTVRAFYNFEGTDTNTIVDSSGNGKNMTLFPGDGTGADNAYSTDVPTLVGGSIPGVKSMSFGGHKGYKINQALTGVDNCVLEAYVKMPASSTNWFCLMSIGGWTNGLGLGGNAINANPYWGVKYYAGGDAAKWVSTNAIRDTDRWVHVALVRGADYNNGKVTLFVNHYKVSEFPATPFAPDGFSFVGSEQDSTGVYAEHRFIGLLDNVRFSTFTGPFETSDLMPKAQIFCGMATQVYKPLDFNTDCYVNLKDFAQFASAWLDCTDPANQESCDSWNGN